LVGESTFPNIWTHCIPATPKEASVNLSATYPLTDGEKTIAIQYRDAGSNTSKTYSKKIIYDTTAPLATYTGLSINQRGIHSGANISGKILLEESNLQKFIWNDNNGNSTLYDPSLILMYNFDHTNALGETGGIVKDISLAQNDGYTQ
jgi:hypothetical protein